MAQPVWVLSVDLQTKTAVFQSGMAEAARSARSAFAEIKSGAAEAGRETGTSMFAARHALMSVSEMFGGTLPRAITAFIADIGPVGAALEAAFPFAAVALGAFLLLEHLTKLREEGEKLTEDQARFANAVQSAFNALDQKILQAGIRADELRNDHLGALHHQLQLINLQSLAELMHSFEGVAKSADVVMEELKAHWYQFGIGSDGAKHALDEFQRKYDALLLKGKDKDASDLLAGTKASAERILQLQNQATGNRYTQGANGKPDFDLERAKGGQAMNQLRQMGVGLTESEVKAQMQLVEALNAQLGIEQRVAELKKADSGNATKETGNVMSAQRSAAAKAAAESQLRMGQSAIAGDRATAEAQLSIHRGLTQQRLALDLDFAQREYEVQVAGNQAQIAALDKSGKDYSNQLKALQDKALELSAANAAKVAELTSKAQTEQAAKDLLDIEQSERAKIEATQQGSAARLAAIDSAIRSEQEKNLQDTSFYRELLTQRVQSARQLAEEESKQKAEAGKEAADNDEKLGELVLARQKAQQALADSSRHISDQQRNAEETQQANAEFAVKLAASNREIAALDTSEKNYTNKLQQAQNKQLQLIKTHENEVASIKEKSAMEQNQRILSAQDSFNSSIASGLTQVLMGHKSFAAAMDSIGNQVVSGIMQNAIKSMMADDMTKERDAAAAARKAFNAGMQFPFPANIIMGPVLGASAFAAVMAFEGGTDSVPGYGTGDKVPSMLAPGEGVVPGGVMDGLSKMARSGTLGGAGPHYHLTMHMHTQAQALDSQGMDRVLTKHADKLQKHFEKAVRRMNRG